MKMQDVCRECRFADDCERLENTPTKCAVKEGHWEYCEHAQDFWEMDDIMCEIESGDAT